MVNADVRFFKALLGKGARMKIGDKRPAGGMPPARPAERTAPARRGTPERARFATDTSTILGIPEAELTPNVRDAIMALMAEVDGLRTELGGMRERLRDVEALADRDPLLPVLNRRAFVRELSRMSALAERYGEQSSLIYFDLDNFKQVNEAFGHAGGDAALLHMAKLLLDNVRETDIVGRLGGDEFAVIMAHADEEVALAKAEILTRLVGERPADFNGKWIELSVSAGATSFSPGEDPGQTLARADKAMFESKRAAR